MNTEPFCQRLENGIEIISDDRKLKFILSPTTIFLGGMEREMYLSRCFVKDGTGWQECNHGSSYEAIDEFIQAIKQVTDFSLAIKDLASID